MKRPDKVILWSHVSKEETEFVNHLGKPLYKYYIKLPSWVGLAYKPHHVKVEVRDKIPSYNERDTETNMEEVRAYVKSNWSKKLTKMRKLNHNYMKVAIIAKGRGFFPSIENYNNYHQELKELNKKYCLDPLEIPSDSAKEGG